MMRETRLFERVRKRIVADVVEQRGETHRQAFLRIGIPELRHDAAREMIGAEGVLEPRMGSAGIDQKRVAELAHVAQALYGWRVEDGKRLGLKADVVPERVANDLELAGGQESGTRSLNCSKFFSNSASSRLAWAS